MEMEIEGKGVRFPWRRGSEEKEKGWTKEIEYRPI